MYTLARWKNNLTAQSSHEGYLPAMQAACCFRRLAAAGQPAFKASPPTL